MSGAAGAIVADAMAVREVVDAAGRRLSIRQQTTLDRLRLFKAVGPVLAENDRYLGLASLAFAVVAIDGVPFPQPANEHQVEAAIHRIGDSGIAAIAASLNTPSPEDPAAADPGN